MVEIIVGGLLTQTLPPSSQHLHLSGTRPSKRRTVAEKTPRSRAEQHVGYFWRPMSLAAGPLRSSSTAGTFPGCIFLPVACFPKAPWSFHFSYSFPEKAAALQNVRETGHRNESRGTISGSHPKAPAVAAV
ncbi:hypothetical protein KL950_000736 [Ogataea haglerorum]|uniref:Uncharacterized protein n=1 Tax=Ogataea haglerorum TaxID=1937702 RepID=A0ABQ7RMA9_9ASCO|nr:hypothetical protein KL950_000736 [Ogataea haglerorum]KAG7768751.1 hypothetical protein KL946_000034 [Ogataea haglerorum]